MSKLFITTQMNWHVAVFQCWSVSVFHAQWFTINNDYSSVSICIDYTETKYDNKYKHSHIINQIFWNQSPSFCTHIGNANGVDCVDSTHKHTFDVINLYVINCKCKLRSCNQICSLHYIICECFKCQNHNL